MQVRGTGSRHARHGPKEAWHRTTGEDAPMRRMLSALAGRDTERGFVLVASMVIMGLLLVLSIGLWYRSAANQRASESGQSATRAYYYAESAINYLTLALQNDAELDGELPANDPAGIAKNYGDWTAITPLINSFLPGPTTWGGTDGQIAYFDNRPTSSRNGFVFDATNPSALNPVFANLISSKQMPQHLVFNIDSSGHITLGTPAYTTSAPSSTFNGALVWLTGVDASNNDVQLDPDPAACTPVADAVACINGVQVSTYDVGAYALSYVNGTPLIMLRAVIKSIP